ncbi:UbiA family prenyltransferase [Actinotalea solisilvae]|uniref:UbiA family prenyltransferase n=1 Tax=Actinotalea solisilvae TaxID=2072922 RepID=UPI0018F262AC|nr:UbiA family prenyltransferase [Actinotalea solisilvae]
MTASAGLRPAPTLVDRVRAYSVLLRTGSVVAAAVLTVVGARLGGGPGPAGRVALGVALVAGAVAFAQVVNDLADVEVDRLGKPHRPLPAGTVGVPAARAVALVAAATSLGAGAALGAAFLAGAAALVGLSWAYSRWLKGTVGLGNVVVALLTSTPLLVGAAAGGAVGPRALTAQLLVAVFMAGFEVVKTGLDRDGDRAAGLRTLATTVGLRPAARVGAACGVAFVAAALLASRLGADPVAYLLVMGVGAGVPTLAAAVLLVRGREPGDLRRPFGLLRLAWFAGIAALALL